MPIVIPGRKKVSDTIILIDIDDTIEYLGETWCEWLNQKYGTNVKYTDITAWDLSLFFPTLSKDQVYEPLHREDFWKLVKPMPDAIKYLKRLVDDGFRVYLCTSTDYRNVKPKYEYIIQKYFPYISWEQIIVAYDKKMIEADFRIDDGVHNLENCGGVRILFTQPHNKSYDTEANLMLRMYNWREIYIFIHKNCILGDMSIK